MLINGQFAQLMLTIALAAISVAVWRWPIGASCAFVALVPVNRFLVLLLFHFTHSELVTKNAQLWKDWIMLLLFVRVLTWALFSTTPKRIKYLDGLVAAFVLLSLLYIPWEGTSSGVDLQARIFGFRLDSFFLIAYFIGRGLPLERRHVRWLVLALIPGALVVAAVAVAQVIQPAAANSILNQLSYQEFLKLQGAVGETTGVRERSIMGASIPRASSLLLGDLALAFFQIFLVAVAAALFFTSGSSRGKILSGGFLLLMVVTEVLTVTRSAAVGVLVVIVFIAVLTRSFGRLSIVVVAALLGTLITLLVLGTETAVIKQLLNPQEGSALAHARAFDLSVLAVQAHPLGQGLGTAGTIGQRFDRTGGLTNENWYLQLATEMGLLAAAIYVAVILIMIALSVREYLRVRDLWLRTVVLASAGAGIGFLIVGNFLHAWENLILSMLIWLFAGIAVRGHELEASWPSAEPR
jgi:hypothetical protein